MAPTGLGALGRPARRSMAASAMASASASSTDRVSLLGLLDLGRDRAAIEIGRDDEEARIGETVRERLHVVVEAPPGVKQGNPGGFMAGSVRHVQGGRPAIRIKLFR